MKYGFIVLVQYTPVSFLVAKPCVKKFGGKMVFRNSVKLFQLRLAVVLQSIFQYWVYQIIFSLLSHL